MADSSPNPTAALNGLLVSVADPLKHNEGVQAWIGYTVVTQADDSRSEFQAPRTSVLRRYSDFNWLHMKLSHSFPGCILPPLPEKAMVGRFEAPFVEARRRALERYLLRVVKHPELGKSSDLVLFLQANEAKLEHAKAEWRREQMRQPKVLRLVKQAFAHMEHSLSSASTGKVEVPRSDSDAVLDDIATCVHVLEVHFHSAAREASTWVRREKEAADGCFQLGLALTLLGQNEAGGLGEVMRGTGHALDAASVLATGAVESSGLLLEGPLVEWSRGLGSAKLALLRRTEARRAYHEALVEVAVRAQGKEKWVGMIGKEDKLQAAEGAWGKAVAAAEAKRKEFETVSGRIVRDWGVFREEKAEELRKAAVAFLEAQVGRHEQMRTAWAGALSTLSEVDPKQGLNQEATTGGGEKGGASRDEGGAGRGAGAGGGKGEEEMIAE
ncbi:hypothetical protein NSK_003260 [Nannochloropsis salina CCMP1776]|uniref:PX domain-containing protein n=1 Tax=Nannochloropsis salina CCMP1776 TaxID=1027361 RepID=A0A4D9D2X9_9STRA|nr:hypothetical protein NSK_003260 [Nannochloropsis salina CCMP1776]|eukprot:TFJ85756.1 hypothetical protein NSK_003260 [Nannochloropsis salina CCMP1776]